MKSAFRASASVSAAIVVLAFLAISCTGPRSLQNEQIRPQKARPGISIQDLEKKIHSLVNSERKKKGLGQLRWNNDLSRIARKHSRDMAKRHYFSHTSPEGKDFSFRYRDGGYACAVPAAKREVYTGAENLFRNNLYDRIVYVNGVAQYGWNTLNEIAESTVRGWMNSPGHKKNILTPHWGSEGIGVAISPDDRIYITQNFC